MASHEFIKGDEITLTDYAHLKKLELGFEFLISFPLDKEFYNLEIADGVIKHNVIFAFARLLGGRECEKMCKEDAELKAFVDGPETQYIPKLPYDEKIGHIKMQPIYVKEGKFLCKYYLYGENKRMLKPIKDDFEGVFPFEMYAPIEIFGKAEELFKPEHIKQKKDNEYSISYAAFKEYWHRIDANAVKSSFRGTFIEKKAKMLKALNDGVGGLKYIQLEDRLVLKSFATSEDYQSYLDLKNNLSTILIIDANGKVVPSDNINSLDLLKKYRIAIAHNQETFHYYVSNQLLPNLMGSVLLYEDKAVLVPSKLSSMFSQLAMTNYDTTIEEREFLYMPQLKKPISSVDDCVSYIASCKKVVVSNCVGLDVIRLSQLVKCMINKYSEQNNTPDELVSYLKQNKIEGFKGLKFKVLPFENANMIVKKLTENEWLFNKKYATAEKQKNAIEFLIESFYDFDIVKRKAMSLSGKSGIISLDSKSLVLCMNNIRQKLYDLMVNPKEKLDDLYIYALIRDELYFMLCMFLGYVYLIYNGFDDDIDDEKSKLSEYEKADLTSKLNPEIFKGFDFVNLNKKGNDRHSSIDTVKTMKTVISVVRNNIAHFHVRVSFGKTGKPEDNYLIFGYNQSPNLYYRITCKDFIEFITNPVFVNHKDIFKTLEVESYDELISATTNRIKPNK